jgi:tRNA modification GTPase
MLQNSKDTIVAIASGKGRGGIGVVRISGFDLNPYIDGLLDKHIKPRKACYRKFLDFDGASLDEGVAIFFPAPNSFTGESVLELQGHGGIVILDAIVQRCIQLGARAARPGEFTERAFLNDKMDLTQAEAIADLIDASSLEAARSAVRSMQGEFSLIVNELVEQIVQIRMYVEAAIDFPEEEIDFLQNETLLSNLDNLKERLNLALGSARQGSLLKDGLTIVLAGKPNAGKSSLLNALARNDAAIVTPIPGTTRDVLREKIVIDGLPLNIIDTAGLRQSDDLVEKEGVKRAWREIETADQILFLVDSSESSDSDLNTVWPEFIEKFPESQQPIILLLNKIDISGLPAGRVNDKSNSFAISATLKSGFDDLIAHLHSSSGFLASSEGVFSARRRHLASLESALGLVSTGIEQLRGSGAGELLAEDLRHAQNALSEITGQFSSDDLLGRIFSSFCIGK